MEKVCPRCKLPQEGITEYEYCGLEFSKYSNEVNSLPKKLPSKSDPPDETQKKKTPSLSVQIILVAATFFTIAYLFYHLFSVAYRDPERPTTSTSIAIGETATTNVRCFGSPTKESLDRAFEIVRSKDTKAIMKMKLSGELVDIPLGTTISVIDRTILKAKIRIQGDSSYLWIYSDWLE